jgi:hypothetical protein
MKKLILILLLLPCALTAQWRSTHSGSRPAVLYPHDSMVFVSWQGGGVSWYTIGALGWAHADTGLFPGQDDKKVKCFASMPGRLFVGGPGVQYSTNNGSLWTNNTSTKFWPGPPSPIGTIDTVVIANDGVSIQRSIDYGISWTKTIQERAYGFISIGNVIYAGTESKFLRSDDLGLTWGKVSDRSVGQMTLIGSDLYTYGGGSRSGIIVRSTDTGQSWTVLKFSDGGVGFGGIGSDLFTIGGVFVYHSSDRGDNWSKVDLTGLPGNMQLTAMCVFDSFLFIGGYDGTSGFGQGVYYRPISEIVPKSAVQRPHSIASEPLRVYPNPFASSCTIDFTLESSSLVRIVILDATGRVTATPVSQRFEAGEHSIPFDASSLPSGTYWCQLASEGKQRMAKVTILR